MLTRRLESTGSGSQPQRHAAVGSSTAKSRFSLDHLFRRIRTKSADQSDVASGKVTADSHRKQLKARGAHTVPIALDAQEQSANAVPRRYGHATLCQSPGGRANVSLAIPVTPRTAARRQSSGRNCSSRANAPLRLDDEVDEHDDQRSSFTLGTWRDSVVLAPESVEFDVGASPDIATTAASDGDLAQDGAVSVVPRDLVPDARTVCSLLSSSSLRVARQYIRQLLRVYVFEVRATKWAAYFLLLVREARRVSTISSAEALSVRFAICAYVRREAEARSRLKQAQEKLFQRKMTEYRVAMQCVCGTSVLKFGRKGKPHLTHLMIENGDTFKWTSAKLLSSKKHTAKKSFSLSEIIDIRVGPTTDVLVKALQKGTLRLQDAKCTLSLVTAKRTFDIKARSTAEREWLFRSFNFLVELAREHEKQVAQQVELSIMKKLETIAVWKHGRRGRPHKTRLFINRYGEISWQGRTGDTIQLEEIVTIELGQVTQVFQRSRSTGLTTARAATRCFSLVTPTRTLDIETTSEQQRDWYVVAIRYLMDKVHEKTAAIKREKAERQLKMLQELCGSQLDPSCDNGNVGISMPPALHA